jgi:hypothetical protein
MRGIYFTRDGVAFNARRDLFTGLYVTLSAPRPLRDSNNSLSYRHELRQIDGQFGSGRGNTDQD